MTLPIGTRVVVTYDPDGFYTGNERFLDGKVGTVRSHLYEFAVGVEFDDFHNYLHALERDNKVVIKNGYGYWVAEEVLTPIYDNQSIEDLL